MHPAKTDLARTALAARDSTLGLAERRLLILCDGKRPLDELTALLGPDTPGMLERLQERGFLTRPPVAEPAPEPRPETPQEAIAPEPATTARNRRSAAIAKIYVTDMLSLMRREDADAMSAHLHAATSEPEVMAAIDATLRFITEVSGPRYARKIATRVAEVVPDAWLAEPDSTLAELASDSAEQV